MTNRFATAIGLLMLAAISGCGDSPTPTEPLPASSVGQNPAPSAATLKVFTDASGFQTSDLRDAQDQIVQFNTDDEFIWAADGTRLPGFKVLTLPLATGPCYLVSIPGTTCSQGCSFEVRFGTKDGQKRAYLTVDYIHDNPGTLVDVELVNGALVVTQTNEFPPGSPTLSGILTELTPSGLVPVSGVNVHRGVTTGWRSATTDKDGFYRILGLIDGTDWVEVSKDGYVTQRTKVMTSGDGRFDIQLVRR
jgi:hypothetical protein